MNPILRIPRAMLRRLGFDVVRYSPEPKDRRTPADRRRLEALTRNGIDVVIDVGASRGEFGTKLRTTGYAGAIVSFEPLRASFDVLQQLASADPLWTAAPAAIGERDGEASINVSGASVSSSLLAMKPHHVDVFPESKYVGTETVTLRTLDSILPEIFSTTDEARYALKLDVQGYERAVLDGAAGTLERTRVIEIELSLVPLYEGSPLYTEIIPRLDALGFRLISWEDVFIDPETEYVLQADCLFISTRSP